MAVRYTTAETTLAPHSLNNVITTRLRAWDQFAMSSFSVVNTVLSHCLTEQSMANQSLIRQHRRDKPSTTVCQGINRHVTHNATKCLHAHYRNMRLSANKTFRLTTQSLFRILMKLFRQELFTVLIIFVWFRSDLATIHNACTNMCHAVPQTMCETMYRSHFTIFRPMSIFL